MNSINISGEEKLDKKTKIGFENLKSDYIFKKIVDYMKKPKSLDLIKMNKALQKRLNLGINDYKDFCQLYTPIEIELKPIENKHGFFIKFEQKEKEYYHIYFDDSNEEIDRNYLDENEKVQTIKIIIDYQIKSFRKLFFNCTNISPIVFKKFYRIDISDMCHMFSGCTSLKEIDFSHVNIVSAKKLNYIFS